MAIDVSSKHIVIYSHGFGVRQDDRGLFTDVAAALPDMQHVMFDYNQVDEVSGNLTVAPLDEQVEKLRQVVAETQANNPDATIDLICHSQGCVVAGLAKPQGIRKAILIGAPAHLNVERMIRLFNDRPGSNVNLDGLSYLRRADFSITTVPPEYWKSIDHVEPIELYNGLARGTELVVINATEDEILGSGDFSGLASSIKVIEIKTGHNFEGEGRKQLLNIITQELNNER